MNKGWRYESYRHGLAARGIPTSRYYAPKIAPILKIRVDDPLIPEKPVSPPVEQSNLHPVDRAYAGAIAKTLKENPEIRDKWLEYGQPKLLIDYNDQGDTLALVPEGGQAIILTPKAIAGKDTSLKNTLKHELTHIEQEKLGFSRPDVGHAIVDAYPEIASVAVKELEKTAAGKRGVDIDAFLPTEWSAYDEVVPGESDRMIAIALKSPKLQHQAKELRLNYEAGLDFAREHPNE